MPRMPKLVFWKLLQELPLRSAVPAALPRQHLAYLGQIGGHFLQVGQLFR